MVVGNGDHGIIKINSRSSEGRQRFSLGHELGHWCLHKGRLLVCQAHEIGAARKAAAPEQAADAYAADLLMPRQILQQHPCCRGPLSFATVRAVAEAFSVSVTAAAIRLVEVEHAPSLLVHHGPEGRRWFVRSPSIPRHWFPKDELDTEVSPSTSSSATRPETSSRV
jgi:Zn-dependent peptidase ImmA (M78 family)